MPSRIIREEILTSAKVDALDHAAEVFYRRLLSKVDDHGLYDARLSVLRASIYPLRIDRVREADCARWLAACEKAGLIALYEYDGSPYLQVLRTRWVARSKPKYPEPRAVENNCAQLKTNVPPIVVVDVVEDVVVVEGADKPPTGRLELPDWLPADAWQDWHQYRNTRKGWTRKAKELSLRTLTELRSKGHDPRAVIEQSIECGWAGLFPIKPKGDAQAAPPRKRKELA